MIICASFYWKNDQVGGLGFTLNPETGWSTNILTATFDGPTVTEYFAASDAHIDDGIVADYLSQLEAIAKVKQSGIPLSDVLIAALNIMWLARRGHISNDDFNGPLFVHI